MNKTRLYALISLILFVLLLLFVYIQTVNAIDIFSFYHEEVRYINHLYINNHADLTLADKITEDEIDNRLHYLYEYSMSMRSGGVNPRRRFKDAVAIIIQETRFVNFQSVDFGAGFGWFSMHKDHIRTLDNYFDFKTYDFTTILNSDKLQAKYVIANYLFLMDTYQDRFKAILGYNRGQAGVKGDKRHENYFFKVIGIIAYYDAEMRK